MSFIQTENDLSGMVGLSSGGVSCRISSSLSGFFLQIHFGGGRRWPFSRLLPLKTITVGQLTLLKIHWACAKMANSVVDYFLKQNEERGETHVE